MPLDFFLILQRKGASKTERNGAMLQVICKEEYFGKCLEEKVLQQAKK